MSVVMFLVGLLLILLGMTCFAGWVWLVIRGFKTSVGWGLAMLFFAPIAAIVAAVKDWQSWKKPFLLYWGSAGLQFAVLIVALIALPFALPWANRNDAQAELASAMEAAQHLQNSAQVEQESATEATPDDSAQAAEPEVSNPESNAAEPDAASARLVDPTGEPAAAMVTDHAARKATERGPASGIEVAAGFEEITVAAAASRTGSKVRIYDREGILHSGVLRGVENGTLIVAFDLGAGTVVTGFEAGEIRSLQVPAAN